LKHNCTKVLEANSNWLEDKGYFIVGNSANPLMGHLLVPYYDAMAGSPVDAFNFGLSNSQIQIECSFVELPCNGKSCGGSYFLTLMTLVE
jgi:hypothetical protein